MDREDTTDFLIVGAGLAGLAFARDLQKKGASVRLLDKGRGLGGRMATRRMSDTIVDHGAQFFTARDDRFKKFVADGERDGWIQVWTNGFPLWENGQINPRPEGHPRYAVLSGMNTLAKRLGDGLSVERSATVKNISRTENGTYRAETAEGQTFTGTSLILNLPPAQLLPLVQYLLSDENQAKIATVKYLPAWSVGVRLEQDIAGADWPALEFKGHPVLGWLSRDHTKRAPGAPPVLIIHGSGDWSCDHLEDNPESVQRTLLSAVHDLFGPLTFGETLVHRWRYSMPTKTCQVPCFWEANQRIGACGDWCDGSRVEGAILSGWHLARAVM